MKQRLILIPGWAHEASLLEPLTMAMKDDFNSVILDAVEFTKSNTTQRAPFWLAGWSLGGMLAMDFASQHPDQVAGLILISTTARFCSGPDYACGQPESALRAMIRGFRADPRSLLRNFFEAAAAPFALPEDSMTRRIDAALQRGRQRLMDGLNYLLSTDLRAQVAKLNMPTLIFHGRKDSIMPFEAGLWLHDAIPASVFEELENAGHDLPVRQPDWLAERILEFVKAYK